MSSSKTVLSLLGLLLVVSAAPLAMAQLAPDELQKDQTFEAIMAPVAPTQPQASGFARVILPSPRFFPLNRQLLVRVEAEGLLPGKTHAIHIHATSTDTSGAVTQGCFAGAPVIINLRSLVGDANGKDVSVTRVILTGTNSVFSDALGRSNAAIVTRATLTRWYVQFHIPAGETAGGSAMACGEINLNGFDRGTPYQ